MRYNYKSEVDMLLFGKKVEIYESRNYGEFKALKKLLKKTALPTVPAGYRRKSRAAAAQRSICVKSSTQITAPMYGRYT